MVGRRAAGSDREGYRLRTRREQSLLYMLMRTQDSDRRMNVHQHLHSYTPLPQNSICRHTGDMPNVPSAWAVIQYI